MDTISIHAVHKGRRQKLSTVLQHWESKHIGGVKVYTTYRIPCLPKKVKEE